MNFTTHIPLKAGFIGGGLNSAVGYTHFNASRLDAHFRVEAGCFSRDVSQNQGSAHTYGVLPDRTYNTWKTMLEQEQGKLDALIILTPTPSHAEIVLSALDAGYAVICEKSLGVSSDECELIASKVAEKEGYLAVTYNYSGYPMVRELQRMIRKKQLGDIQQIHVEMPQETFLRKGVTPQDWRCHDYSVPTVSLDLGVHVHHLVDFLTDGLLPLSVVGNHAHFGQFDGVVDNIYCMADYEKGMKVMAWWGKTALGQRNGLQIRVYGSLGGAVWNQMDPENLQWSDNEGHHFLLDRGSTEAKVAQQGRYNRFKPGHPSGFVEAFANLYTDIAMELRSLNSNSAIKSEYVYGATHAKESLRFLENVSQSAIEKIWLDFS